MSGWRDRLPISRLDETTFVHRIFGGYLRSQVKCTKCGYCSNTYDPFLDLALEVSKKSITSVAAAFQEFTRKETLDVENKWQCSGCQKRVCATKQLTVFRPPLSLCVQMKRFTFGGFGFVGLHSKKCGGKGDKISKPIAFPAEMELPLSDSRACEYGLTGMVIHVGGSADTGHYTAYVKEAREGSHQWYHVDDSFVEAVSEKTVLRERNAYLLFYCRKEVRLEFPSPPRRGSMTAEEATEHGRARAQAKSDGVGTKLGKQNFKRRGEEFPKKNATSTPSCDYSDNSAYRSDHEENGKYASTTIMTGACEKKQDAATESQLNCERGKTKKPVENGNASNSIDESSSSLDYGSSSSAHDRSISASSEYRTTPGVGNAGWSPKRKAAGTDQPRKKKSSITLVKLDLGSGREKVSVVMGHRVKKENAWVPSTTGTTRQGEGYELLGNRVVEKWGDDIGDADRPTPTEASNILEARSQIVSTIEKKNRARKRKSFVDSWDSSLDRGRVSFVFLFHCGSK